MNMTRRFSTIGKSLICFFAVIGFAMCGLFTWAVIKQAAKDREYATTTLLPIANHVEQMKRELGRLPTTDEFRIWADKEYENKLIEYYPSRPDFCKSWGKEGEAFLVGAWRGEWVHYYCSWNGKNFSE